MARPKTDFTNIKCCTCDKGAYVDPESEKRGCVYQVDMTNYEEKHNNILQNIHTLALEILQEYDMISAQYWQR